MIPGDGRGAGGVGDPWEGCRVGGRPMGGVQGGWETHGRGAGGGGTLVSYPDLFT